MKKNAGFTLVEVLIYAGLSSVLIGLFAGILITSTRIQGQQSASTTLTGEINFLLATIKQKIGDSTNIVFTDDDDITLTTNTYPSFPTRIFLEDGLIKLTENNQPATPLSTTKIVIDSLMFVDLSVASSQAVQIQITASSNTTNPQNAATRSVQTTASPLIQAQ